MASRTPKSAFTLHHLLAELFPHGTGGDATIARSSPRRWDACPPWPADLFGIVAKFADMSGCYAEPGVILSRTPDERKQKKIWAKNAADLGMDWSEDGIVPAEVQDLWLQFVADVAAPIHAATSEFHAMKVAAMRLLAIADEAGAGFGFVPETGTTDLSSFVFKSMLQNDSRQRTILRLPSSLTWQIDPDRLCVMPKSLTPSVGCTLRSLSLHLALLPGAGTVKPRWFIATTEQAVPGEAEDAAGTSSQTDRMNILVVPFPFDLSPDCFTVAQTPDGPADGYFSLQPNWLSPGGRRVTRDELTSLMADLICGAARQLGTIHGIILPETSLDQSAAEDLVEDLARIFTSMEIVVAGILSADGHRRRNQAILARLGGNQVQRAAIQSKHHRWRLDGGQINRYQLARFLDPKRNWWEKIDVDDRELIFGLARNDTVVAALICEDLARFDPVMPALNAVGPNLVVALLMDGPQLQQRWPGRYATVLADDPGSAVLSVTCLGMVKLSRLPGEEVRRVIGLWKDTRTGAKELLLPIDAHALALCIDIGHDTQTTMDLRQDDNTTVSLSLAEVWPVSLQHPPDWLAKP
jgi:hypothetical protein